MIWNDTAKAETRQNPYLDGLSLRYRVIFACIAVFVLAAVLLLNIFSGGRVEAVVRQKADAVLAERFNAIFAGMDAPVTGTRVYPERGGDAFQFVFLAQGQSQTDNSAYSSSLIFVVPVIGISGPAVSVFYYTQDKGAMFLGDCSGHAIRAFGSGGLSTDTEISAANLRKWTSRIEAAARGIIAASMRAGG